MHVVFSNPEIIFYHFLPILNLDIFLSSNITEVYREQVLCPLNSSHIFETSHGLLGWPEDMHVDFSES